ncbi:alpha/beta fold family hydrolase [Natrialba magadii ATCC 43099]|uniref:Alpha/beta fold family hydrolase n=1 Tax=Natrialba magadii (strain ATCC 43099 / DSM 3394 / CCM 3739 / CIP 104546 / IAM 13178 / JCM 8861 / NBRC 102185 / NCIMB 2190 / MS3) TaxID=547559 RepID=L9V1Z4_NATMM|nr:alpha/beta fold family hydrolase [Natrialba magadii ATCC 43099]
MEELNEHGIVIQEDDADEEEVTHVDVVDSLEPDDDYDLVLVVMGEQQSVQILDTLAENEHVPTFCFMGNNVSGPDKMVQALGKERVMLGFPYPGGKRDGHVMRVLPINEDNQYTIPIGEVDGSIRSRTRAVAAVLSDMRGYDVEIRTDMDEWLKYHVALLMSGLVPALYAADTRMNRLGETRDLLVRSVRATKEALRGLRKAGYSPSPPVVRSFEYVPEPICVWTIGWLMRNEYAKVSVEGHARDGRDEMAYLFTELRALIEQADGDTEAIDQLAPYYDPDTPSYPAGKRDLSMKWGGLVAPVGGMVTLAVALALALRRLRSKSSADSAAERESGGISYEVGGPEEATAVVFTHGFALGRETWREQTATLSESYRVLSWDVPGCGESAESSVPVRFDVSTRKLLDVLDDEGIDQAVLVGQSMGSLLNQYVAYHHPDRVRALVHVGGFPLHEGFSERTIKLMGVHVRLLQLLPEKLTCDMFGRLVARTPEAQEYAKRASERTGKANMVSLERVFLEDIEEGIPEQTELPQLIVAGEDEYFWLQKKAKEWDKKLRNSEYKAVPDAGHLANHDNPAAFNEILSPFLESLD